MTNAQRARFVTHSIGFVSKMLSAVETQIAPQTRSASHSSADRSKNVDGIQIVPMVNSAIQVFALAYRCLIAQ